MYYIIRGIVKFYKLLGYQFRHVLMVLLIGDLMDISVRQPNLSL